MAITTLSMVLTVFVLNLHHISDRPVPGWVRTLVLLYLARMLGICIKLEDKKEPRLAKAKNRRFKGSFGGRVNFRRASLRLDGEGDEQTAVLELHPCGNSSNPNSDAERVSLMDKEDDILTLTSSLGGTPRSTPHVTPHNTPRHAPNYGSNSNTSNPRFSNFTYSQPTPPSKPKDPDYSKEWKTVAEVFDRLFFWLFLFAILISTLVLFHPLSDAYMKRKMPASKKLP